MREKNMRLYESPEMELFVMGAENIIVTSSGNPFNGEDEEF